MANDGANEGFWRFQIRDKYGRWVEMGGAVTFTTDHPNFGRISGTGLFEGGSRPGFAMVRVKNHATLDDGVYEVSSDDIESVQAIIPADAPGLVQAKKLDAADGITVNAPTSELKDSITGDEALQKIYGGMGIYAKKSGRFAVGRGPADVKAAAKETYKVVYEKLKVEYPELMTEFGSYQEYWDRASNGLAAGFMTRWEESADDINPLTKASNKIYAREILGLKEDGLIEFYRNAVNHMSTKEWSAAGYASLDRRMAWDYNAYLSKYADSGLQPNDGRYIIKAKPEELSGLIGFSQIPDEYGVVIGLDVVSQDGRAERVGDLEMQKVSPWSNDIEEFDRSGGASPFRRVSPASQFEVFATDNPVPSDDYAGFYESFQLDASSRPIPTKWDEMFGAGSFDLLNGQYPSYKTLQSYFMDAGNGKVGLDMLLLDKLSSRYSGDPQPNDEYDKTLKMLSVIQELSGKIFMVHRGHKKDDPRVIEAVELQDSAATPVIEISNGHLYTSSVELTEEEAEDMTWYGDDGYMEVSDYLRTGVEPTDEVKARTDSIVSVINRSTVESDSVLYRGRVLVNAKELEEINSLEVGDEIVDPGVGSSTTDFDRAKFYATMNLDSKVGQSLFKINVPAGAHAYRIPDEIAEYSADKETLLPPNTKLRITKIQESGGIRIFEADLVLETAEEQDEAGEDKVASIWGDAAPNERDVVAAAYEKLPADVPVADVAALDPDFATYPDSIKNDPESIKEVAIDAMQQLVRKWNGSSIYDDSTKALHEVAREHFGISGATPVEMTEGSKALMENKEAYKAVLDAVYASTQEMFADAGIEEITVYRGTKTDSSGIRPLSSWTTNEATARAFAGKDGDTRKMTVPVSQVLSTAMSGGLGAWNENEVILLGSPKAPELWKDVEPGVQDLGVFTLGDVITGVSIDLDTIASPISSERLNDVTALQKEAVDNYSIRGYKPINAYLRSPDNYVYEAGTPLEDVKKMIAEIDDLIESNSTITTGGLVFRGMNFYEPSPEGPTDWAEVLNTLEVGDVISDPGYMSTSNDPVVAFRDFGPGFGGTNWLEDGTAETTNNAALGSAFWAINVPEGAKALVLSKGLGLREWEDEVILPRDSQIKINGIRRVQQLEDGEPVQGAYNYYIEAELIPQDKVGVIDVVDKTAEERGAVDSWAETSPGVEGIGESSVLDDNLTGEIITYEGLSSPVYAMDSDMFTKEQRVAIKGYTGVDYKHINKLLRTGEAVDSLRAHLEKEIADIDSAIDENGVIEEPARVFRGIIGYAPGTSGFNGTDWSQVMKDLKVGDVFTDEAYMSTSNKPAIAYGFFGAGLGASGYTGSKDSPSNQEFESTNANVFFSIDLPAGSKALGIPDDFSTSSREEEVLLPRGTKLKVKAIRRVKQRRFDAEVYNYFVETEVVND